MYISRARPIQCSHRPSVHFYGKNGIFWEAVATHERSAKGMNEGPLPVEFGSFVGGAERLGRRFGSR